MSGPGIKAIEPLADPAAAFEAALLARRWTAATGPRPFRLSGALLDGEAEWVTDVFVMPPGHFSLETRLPFVIPPQYQDEATLLCSIFNERGREVVSIDPDGAPAVFRKVFLVEPTLIAGLTIIDAIQAHRQAIGEWFSPGFAQIASGGSATEIAAQAGLEEFVHTGDWHAATFDLARLPEARSEDVEIVMSDLPNMTKEEATSYVRLHYLNNEAGEAAPCAGPVVFHADGTLECHGCERPETYYHPSGTTASCTASRHVGRGYICSRCDPHSD
jgi:hypothetical protein